MDEHPRTRIERPEDWHRRLCPVGDTGIFLCGDLPPEPIDARRQLRGWTDAGITHIVDLREEWSDERLVARHAPTVGYTHLGIDDDGTARDPEWFSAGVTAILAALSHPDGKVVVHCHMGVNRGPSMAFAALLALGLEPAAALDEIRRARPIAAVVYAEDAVRWWHEAREWDATTGTSPTPALTQRREVREWHRANPCDASWIISRIRRASGA